MKRRAFLASLGLGAVSVALADQVNTVVPVSGKNLQFREGKPFRIVQFTDTHYIPNDKRTTQVDLMIEKALSEDKPDLAIFTGDCVNNNVMERGWKRFAELCNRYKTPYAATLGNHDHEGKHSRKSVGAYISSLPGSLMQTGPADLPGSGNFTLPIFAPDGKSVRFVLYLMDSQTYAGQSLMRDMKIGGYGWFESVQIEWFKRQVEAYKKANGGKPVYSAAFFHIPFPEYTQVWSKGEMKPVGKRNEGVCCPKLNSGMFHAMLESRSVISTFCGHDHDNDYIGTRFGMGLAYGRFSGGTNTYQHWENGARIIDIAPDGRSLTTFTHLRSGSYGEKVTLKGRGC